MQKPTTTAYAELNAQLQVLCEQYHHEAVLAEIEAICARYVEDNKP